MGGGMTFEERMSSLRWGNLTDLTSELASLLVEMSEAKRWLAERIDCVIDTPDLLQRCEQLNIHEKLVLYADTEADVQLRLHRYRTGVVDWPHNHRYRFGTVLLRGVYTHTIFGDCDNPPRDGTALLAEPAFIGVLHKGQGYVLSDSMIHLVGAAESAISLVVRGPRLRPNSINYDPISKIGQLWSENSEQSLAPIVLERPRLEQIRKELIAEDIIAPKLVSSN
jgi:hypothetical protein